MDLKVEDRNFLIGVIIAGLLAWVLSLVPIWQLILIAGIVAGSINKTVRRGTLSGALGVFLSWLGLMLYGNAVLKTISMLDQFGGLIGIDGIGGLLFVLILLFGMLFGALGGAIGCGIVVILKNLKSTETPQE